MKILHVLDHSVPFTDGYSMRTLSIIREQRKRGWLTTQLTSPKHGGGGGCEVVDGLEFYRTAPARGALSRISGLWPIHMMGVLERRLKEVVEKERPDIIHAHSPVLNAWPALRVAKSAGVPVVYEIRAFWEDAAVDQGTNSEGDLRYRLTRAFETRVAKRADGVVTICEGLRKDLLCRGVAADDVTVVPNAVDVSRFEVLGAKDSELAARYGLQAREVVGFCGSFYAYEGLELLVSAFPAVLSARPQARLLLVGGGDEEGSLRRQAEEMGLGDHVIFTGRVPNSEIARYYSLIDVLAFPRTRMRLTELVTPLKPLEAMAMGRVVVASDVGGHCELIENGKTGLLFPAGSRDQLANAVVRVLHGRDLRSQLCANGRRFVERERTWAASVARYSEIYDRALRRKGRSILTAPSE